MGQLLIQNEGTRTVIWRVWATLQVITLGTAVLALLGIMQGDATQLLPLYFTGGIANLVSVIAAVDGPSRPVTALLQRACFQPSFLFFYFCGAAAMATSVTGGMAITMAAMFQVVHGIAMYWPSAVHSMVHWAQPRLPPLQVAYGIAFLQAAAVLEGLLRVLISPSFSRLPSLMLLGGCLMMGRAMARLRGDHTVLTAGDAAFMGLSSAFHHRLVPSIVTNGFDWAYHRLMSYHIPVTYQTSDQD